jgi:outer membrane protein TolC
MKRSVFLIFLSTILFIPQLIFAESNKVIYDLDRCIEVALDNNPELTAAEFDTQAMRARKDAARGALFPKLSVEGSYAHYLDTQRLIPARYNGESGVFSHELFSGDVVLRQPLFTGGQLVNEIRVADLLKQSSEYRITRTRDQLIFNVSSIFYSILVQKQLIRSLEFSKMTLENHLKRVNELIELQKSAKVDRLRMEVKLSDVNQKLVRERNILLIQHRLLANLMGIEESSTLFTVEGTLEHALPVLAPVENNVAIAFKQRPDYLAAKKEQEAQTRRIDVARAGHLPKISAFGSYGGRGAFNPTEQPSNSDEVEDVGKAGLVIEIPLFEGGRIQAHVREEQAKLGATQERFRKLELQIRMEVETALSNITSAFERIQTTEKIIEQARESLRIEQEKYELGKGAILDVLDAQTSLLEAETNFYRALVDFNIEIAQFRLAIGENVR